MCVLMSLFMSIRYQLNYILVYCMFFFTGMPALYASEYTSSKQDRATVGYKYVTLNNQTPIEKQMIQDSTIYVVKDVYDLGCVHKSVNCNTKTGSRPYYYDNRIIHIERGESMVLPANSFVLDANLSIIAKGYIKASRAMDVYLASTKEKVYDYFIGKELTIPVQCVLRFEGGLFVNGIINMSGSIIDAKSIKVFRYTTVRNLGNDKIRARWFFENGDCINSNIIDNLGIKEIDYEGLSLVSSNSVSFANANWRNLILTTPKITIGNDTPIKSDFSISRSPRSDEYVDSHVIDVVGDFSDFKGYIVLLSTGEHVDYDWREEGNLPTLYKGVTSIIEKGGNGSVVIEDFIGNFQKQYSFISHSKKEYIIQSKGYLYEPCCVCLEDCKFISSKRTGPGFMYIYSAKDFRINNCLWDGGDEGSPSLLGINACVNGIIQNSLFTKSYYNGTETSYGLQLFNSTRINTFNCTFSNNRRGYDVSGNKCQTRYCVIENCRFVGSPMLSEGSGLGGHSTSYGNIFRNNIIEGSSAIAGIQTRGDNEVIEGNIFYGRYKAATITCVKNTIIRNNVCIETPSSSFIWIESISDDNNEILVEGNKFSGGHFVRGQKVLSCNVIIRDNSFYYTSVSSSLVPYGNAVKVNCYNNRIIKASEKAVLYYKLNTTASSITPYGVGESDKVDLTIQDKVYVIQ